MGRTTTAPTPDALLRRLEWTVLKRLDGMLQGDWRTLWRGGGLDLADLREYQIGDDARHIDWNVTARLDLPHVRLFTEDRELSAWFLLDLSSSVDFGSGDQTRRELSTAFVGVLARWLTQRGNRVGAMLYDQRVGRVLPPRGGRSQVLQLLAAMAAQDPGMGTARSGAASADPDSRHRETRLADLLCAADATIRRRALILVVSDFISAPGWVDALGRLARRHEVLAVRLGDAADASLPEWGLLTVEDAETGEQLLVDSDDPDFRARFEAAAAVHDAEVRAGLIRAGVDTLELFTGDDLLGAMIRFAALRRLRSRGSVSPRAATPNTATVSVSAA